MAKVLLALFALTLTACHNESSIEQPASRVTVEGRFTVEFMMQTDSTSTQGATLGEITSLHFHERYVVVEDADGAGRLLPLDKIRHLSWTPVK